MFATPGSSRPSRLAGRLGPAGWYLAGVILLFGIRSGTTLAGGADWGLPGTGWRSVWQLEVVALAVLGLVFASRIRLVVGIVAAQYLLATVLELVGGDTLFGAIPVDMRDRLVHPVVGVLGVVVTLVVGGIRMRTARRVQPIA